MRNRRHDKYIISTKSSSVIFSFGFFFKGRIGFAGGSAHLAFMIEKEGGGQSRQRRCGRELRKRGRKSCTICNRSADLTRKALYNELAFLFFRFLNFSAVIYCKEITQIPNKDFRD